MTESQLATVTPIQTIARPVDEMEPRTPRQAIELAQMLWGSGLAPKALTSPQAVMYVMLAGRDMGLNAVQSLRNLHIIDGKIQASADLMQAQVHRSGLAEYFQQIESTDLTATFETKRKGSPAPVRATFTMAMATTAGITKNPVWIKHPNAMLRARAISTLARIVYPDAVAGMYDEYEMHDRRNDGRTDSAVGNAQPAHITQTPANVNAMTAVPPADPAAKWLAYVAKSAAQPKPVAALLEAAAKCERCPAEIMDRVAAAWGEAFSAAAKPVAISTELVEKLRAAIVEIPPPFNRVGSAVCDQLIANMEPDRSDEAREE